MVVVVDVTRWMRRAAPELDFVERRGERGFGGETHGGDGRGVELVGHDRDETFNLVAMGGLNDVSVGADERGRATRRARGADVESRGLVRERGGVRVARRGFAEVVVFGEMPVPERHSTVLAHGGDSKEAMTFAGGALVHGDVGDPAAMAAAPPRDDFSLVQPPYLEHIALTTSYDVPTARAPSHGVETGVVGLEAGDDARPVELDVQHATHPRPIHDD